MHLRRIIGHTVAVGALIGIAGCESFNLHPPEVEALVSGTDEATVLTNARAIMAKYLDKSGELSMEREYFNLPMLGGAAAAAGALVFGGGPPQLNIVKGAGLGAATITATQTYLSPTDRMNAYASGGDAVACVIDAGSILATGEASPSAPRTELSGALAQLQQSLSAAKVLDASPPPATLASDLSALKTAETAASAAIDAINLDIDALNSQVPDTTSALRAIITKVRNVVLTSKTVDFSSTMNALVQAANQAAASQVKKDQASIAGSQPPAAGLVPMGLAPSTVPDATQQLLAATATANIALRHGFAQQKAKLAACPAQA